MMRRAIIFGTLLLAGCGGGDPGPPLPIHVEECTAWIQTRLARPDTFQFRSSQGAGSDRYRNTIIQFSATAASGSRQVCEAICDDTGPGDAFVAERSTIGGTQSGVPCAPVRAPAG